MVGSSDNTESATEEQVKKLFKDIQAGVDYCSDKVTSFVGSHYESLRNKFKGDKK